MILSPRRPSVSIRATESARMRSWTRRAMSRSTCTLLDPDSGSRIAPTRPTGTPASRTVAPGTSPPIWLKLATSRYWRSNRPADRPSM